MRRARARRIARCGLALLYLVAGWFHLTAPAPFLRIIPGWVPEPAGVVLWTGIAEIFGALALVQPWSAALRRAGGVSLAIYTLAVWPANMNHFAIDMADPDGGWGLVYHVPRLLAQPLLMWLALWAADALPGTPRKSKAARLPQAWQAGCGSYRRDRLSSGAWRPPRSS